MYAATRRNLAIVGFAAEWHRADYEAGLRALEVPVDEQLVVFIALPWGAALAPARGLDLRGTTPPVTAILDVLARTFSHHSVLVAIQLHETVLADSLV